ncbi:MAG: MFS transporter [Chitinophagaceae bacterium]
MSRLSSSRVASGFFFFACGLIFASWAARIPYIKDLFQLNEAELGGVLFMLPLGSFLALPFAGWVVHKFGSKTICFLSALLYALILVGISLAHTVTFLSISLFFFGFMGDILNIAMNTQGLDVQKQMNKPILSSFHAMWSVGAFTGALIGGWALKFHLTINIHYIIIMLLIIILSLIAVKYLLPESDHEDESKPLFAKPDKALWIIGLICLCGTLCEGAMADWSALYYRQIIKDVSKVSTTGFTAYIFFMSVGRFLGDRVIMHLGYRKVIMMDSFLIAGGLLIAVGLAMPWAVLLGFAMAGFGVSTIIPVAYTVAGQSKTMKPSVALAAVSTIGFSGFLIGPPVIGFIANATGLRYALLLVVLLGVVIYFMSRRIKTN